MPQKDSKIQKLVEESGMITHFKTTNVLREKEWEVLISPYYHDTISDTVRETDLIAERQFVSNSRFDSSVQINIQLFIECKYIKQEVVFWFDEMAEGKAIATIEKETGLKIPYMEGGGDILPTDLHYLKLKSVAKLFSANSSKEDVVYKAMNQCLHSQIHNRQAGKKPIFNDFIDRKEVFSKIIQYPIVVCDNFDNLLKVEFKKDGSFSTEKLQDHFVLETNYRDDYFLIDIVDIKYLETFLSNFETEAKALVKAYSLKQRRN